MGLLPFFHGCSGVEGCKLVGWGVCTVQIMRLIAEFLIFNTPNRLFGAFCWYGMLWYGILWSQSSTLERPSHSL